MLYTFSAGGIIVLHSFVLLYYLSVFFITYLYYFIAIWCYFITCHSVVFMENNLASCKHAMRMTVNLPWILESFLTLISGASIYCLICNTFAFRFFMSILSRSFDNNWLEQAALKCVKKKSHTMHETPLFAWVYKDPEAGKPVVTGFPAITSDKHCRDTSYQWLGFFRFCHSS